MEHKKELLREIKESNSFIDRIPTEPPNHKHNTTTCALTLGSGLMESIQEKISKMNKTYDPLKCTVEVSQGRVNEQACVTVKIHDSDGSPCQLPHRVHVELHSLTNPSVSIEAEVHAHTLSHYEAQYKPSLNVRGHFELTVRISSDTIHARQVFIECPPVALDQPVHILHKISTPGCLRMEKERILLICGKDEKRCIKEITSANPLSDNCVFPSNLKPPNQYKEWFPVEIAFSDENNSYYVTDEHYNKIHMFSATEGVYIKSVGGFGHQWGKFNGPNGICIVRENVYICDSSNHRVQVYDQRLKFIQCFGSKGREPGKFNWPDNVAFDSNSGHIFVTELRNNRIQCLTTSGSHIKFIGSCGSGPEKLIEPNILLIHDNHIYVSDNKGVSIFTLHGDFVKYFATMCCAVGEKAINGLAVDKEGFVYVSDDPRNRVVIF